MSRSSSPLLVALIAAVTACGDRSATSKPIATIDTARAIATDSVAGSVAAAATDAGGPPGQHDSRSTGAASNQPVASASSASPATVATPGAPNELGRIPVLEYHVIGGDKNTLYTRTAASFKADLEDAYRRGYRPVNLSDLLDRKLDLPAGQSPVVFVFDDASPSQFRYVDAGNGKLDIDPTSAVGLWLDFAKSHPGWSNKATFCMLNGGAAGHNFFGDGPKFDGQQRAWRFQKVKWLADQGFELCGHTLWHAMLNKYSDAVVQEQITRNVMGIDSVMPGYKIRTFALPYGLWPKNRPLAWAGSWTDPKTGKAHPYHFDAVLEVAGGPTRSPYDPKFDPHSITRIEAIGDDIRKTLDRLDVSGRYVSDGKPGTVAGR